VQRAILGTVCAALVLCGCDKSESDPGAMPAVDAAAVDAGAVSDAAAVSDPSAAQGRDAGSAVPAQAADASGPMGAAGSAAAVRTDGGASVAVIADAGPSAPPVAPPVSVDNSVVDGGVAAAAPHPGWGAQSCDREGDKPGCGDESVALCICRGPDASGGNEFCCSEKWSYLCVDGVAALPECKFTTKKCCEAHPTDGCDNPTVEQCVCDEVKRQKQEESAAGRDPALVHDCCSEGFNDFCAILADTVCGAGCSPP
jgi:hypothetical protein